MDENQLDWNGILDWSALGREVSGDVAALHVCMWPCDSQWCMHADLSWVSVVLRSQRRDWFAQAWIHMLPYWSKITNFHLVGLRHPQRAARPQLHCQV